MPYSFAEIFPHSQPLVLEIGFGNGEVLANNAKQQPGYNHLGIEVHRPGVGQVLHELDRLELTNVRVFCHDAVEVVKYCLSSATLTRIQIFFPDPWPKKRHHKRRLIQPDFVKLLVDRLVVGGTLELATDWENYAEHMMQVLEAQEELHNCAGKNNFSSRSSSRMITKFEQRGLKLGHGTWDLCFVKHLLDKK
jgi:tRNA (guanine-N7-)-methyltransferase